MSRVRPYTHYKFPDEIEIQIKKLSDSDCKWFGVKPNSYEFRTDNYGWFPTNVISGVNTDGKYYDKYEIGLVLSGNMGTAAVAVTNKEKTIELLMAAGFIIQQRK